MSDSNQIYQPTPALAGVMQNVLKFINVQFLKNIMKFIAFIFSLFLTACVTTPELITTTVQIDDRVFEVRNSNPHGRTIQSAIYANKMLSSASKKSIALGCEYFVATQNASQSFKTPQGNISEGLSRLDNGQVIYKTGQGQIYSVIRPDPRVNVFVCFNQKPDALLPGLVFNAKYVADSLPD
jgi:hypothetical protein